MKVLCFPASTFAREDLDKMSDNELYHFCEKYQCCNLYNSIHEFQEAFNDGDVSDEWYIYFID